MSDDIHKDNVTEDGQLPGSEKPISQEELNRIIGERLARDRETYRKSFLSELGVADLDDLKGKLESLHKIEDERLSEKEKLEKARDELAQQLAGLRSETSTLASALKQERLHRLVEAEAYRLNFSDPTDAVRLLDFQALEDGDGDKPLSPEAVQKALKTLADSKAYLLKSGKPSPPTTNAGAGGAGGGSAKEGAEKKKALLEKGRKYTRQIFPSHVE